MNLLELAVKIGVDDQVTGKLGKVAEGAKSVAGGIAKAGAAIGGTVVAAGTAASLVGKSALDAYANYEQLAGGVAKLYGNAGQSIEQYAASAGKAVDEVQEAWERNNAAQEAVMKNAQQAFKTTGMSANEYMEQATSFSAALVNSLGGDTAKAAEQTDVAMRAIADNVNTFGSDMGSVQMAFQGFAKQNYTMLDNLKLGFGGTKEEMERLIAEANAWGAANGRASNLSIDSFSDVVTAIQQIQEKQQIAGTTAREAATTIEGSIAMTKAAWQNLLTEFGKNDGDVGARVGELVDSAKTALLGHINEATGEVEGGIIPRFTTIMSNVAQQLPTIMTALFESVGQLVAGLGEAIASSGSGIVEALLALAPQILEGAIQAFSGIAQAVTDSAPQVIGQLGNLLTGLIDSLINNAPAILEGAGQMFMSIAMALAENAPQVLLKLGELLINLVGYILTHIPDILAAAVELAGALIKGFAESLPDLLIKLGEFFLSIGEFLSGAVGDFLRAGVELIGGIIQGIADAAGGLFASIGGVIASILKFFADVPGNIAGFFASLPGMIGGFFEGAKNGAVDAFNGLVEFVSHIPDRIVEFFSGIGSWLVDSGKSLINGFLDGIKGAFDGAKNFVEEGLAGLRKLFPFSPAKEGPFSGRGWTLYSGRSLIDAFAEGASSRVEAAQKTLSTAAGALSEAFTVTANPFGLTMQAAAVGINGSTSGDVYNVTLNVNNPSDYDGMALAFVQAVQARNRLRGNRVSSTAVRRVV